MAFGIIEILIGLFILACVFIISYGVNKDPVESSPSSLNNDTKSYTTQYTGKIGTTEVESNVQEGLHSIETRQTPASMAAKTPRYSLTNRLPEMTVPLEQYTRDGKLNSHKFSQIEESNMLDNIFSRNVNRTKTTGEQSLSGTIFQYTDYGGGSNRNLST